MRIDLHKKNLRCQISVDVSFAVQVAGINSDDTAEDGMSDDITEKIRTSKVKLDKKKIIKDIFIFCQKDICFNFCLSERQKLTQDRGRRPKRTACIVLAQPSAVSAMRLDFPASCIP